MRRPELSFFYFSGDLKFRQRAVKERRLESVGRLAQCRTEEGVIVISGKQSVKISPLIYKNATVHNKCAFRGKQSVYKYVGGEICVYIIFFPNTIRGGVRIEEKGCRSKLIRLV